MSEPLVSIVIPVFNGENYLSEAIDSALAQTYSNLEIIVVNDGSTDNGATERIALSYGDKIRYFYKKNGGVATALNKAISEMKGVYFSWLSHDDMYYANKVEKQIQALRKHGDMTAIVHSDYDLIDETTGVITNVLQSKMYPIELLKNSVFPVLQGLVHGCTLLIHRSHFDRVGIFNENLITTQDYDLWFRMMRHQETIYITEPLVQARLHNAQGSKTITCHQSERGRLYFDFLESLSDEEMCSMYGSPYNFYHRMSCFFKGINMNEAFSYANKKFIGADTPDDLFEKLRKLGKYINKLSNENAKQICIFGAGEYGMRLYQELISKQISVHCFADNNPEKWGILFDGISCISPKQLEKEKDFTLVIVANRTPGAILEQLKSHHFPFIITKQEIDKLLIQVPPVRQY